MRAIDAVAVGSPLRHDAPMVDPAEQRRAPRIDVALACTLQRTKGSPIAARTLNLGSGGMLVSSARPLAVDEELDFALADLDVPIAGHARVMRQQLHDVYALRFEGLPEAMVGHLHALAAGAGTQPVQPL